MADLNALIAQGAQFVAPPDPFVQYGKMQQLRVGENQNALAQYQLESARRTDLKQNALNRAYSDAVNSDTGLIDYGRLSKSLVASGAGSEIPAVLKQQAEFKKAQDESTKLQGELLANKLKLLPDAYKMATTPDAYIDLHKSIHADPILGPWLKSTGATPERGFAQIQEAVKNGKFNDLRISSMQSVDQLLEGLKPKTDIGKLIEARNQLPLNDPNRKLYDQQINDLGAANRNAQQRLAFDQAKFAWEKANPGYELKEDANGGIVGVNKRTLEAIPVTVGGATPPVAGAAAAVPAVNIPQLTDPKQPNGKPLTSTQLKEYADKYFKGDVNAGIQYLRKEGWVEKPADVAVPAIVGPRTQLMGKAQALTESQGNATAFGMRMNEAHSALKKLESKGETGTGVIGGTVGGVAGLVPLIGDKLTAGVDNIFNVLPGVLGGYSSEQQQVLNGRINFITAVLRKESGATIQPSEFATAERLYFPKPGDSDVVIKQKQKARELAIQAMKIQAGPGAKNIGANAPVGGNANDPLNLGI